MQAPPTPSLKITNLCQDLIENHHAFVRTNGPKLLETGRTLARQRVALNLPAICELLKTMLIDLDLHMLKEEMILFPYCQRIAVSETPIEMHCGSLANPIMAMQADHHLCNEQLHALAKLTHHYTPTDNASPELASWLKQLQAFAEDLQLHIYKEDAQLFPMALLREQELNARVSP